MAWNLVQNPDGSAKVEVAPGVYVEVGQGSGANAARTYLAVFNTAGVKTFISVDTTTLVVSPTKP